MILSDGYKYDDLQGILYYEILLTLGNIAERMGHARRFRVGFFIISRMRSARYNFKPENG
jgi:hypothetical protein